MKFISKHKKPLLIVLALLIGLAALGLRWHAVTIVDIDDDENTYLIAAMNYTNYIRSNQYNMLAWDTTNFEHPPLFKIIYGIDLLSQPKLNALHISDFQDGTPIMQSQGVLYGLTARKLSAVIGSLAVFILALLNPVAGIVLAINTLCIKYTSEVYLEALPLLTSLIAILAFVKYLQYATASEIRIKKMQLWLALSALGLGLTAASKYIYCVCGIAILIYWAVEIFRHKFSQKQWGYILAWVVCVIATFFVFDPYLWPHPISRFIETISFHLNYSSKPFVTNSGYPFWQPLNWLFDPFATHKTQSNSAFLFHVDPYLFVFAVLGLPRLFKKNPLFFAWLMVGLLFLFVWSTKWTQYPLIIMAPYCLSAAYGVTSLYDIIKKLLNRMKRKPSFVS